MTTTMLPPGTDEAASANRSDLSPLDLSRTAQDLQIRKAQVEAVARLLDEGNTIPFITRYRKERTGGLDEDILRVIAERVGAARQLAERKAFILRTLEAQHKDKLTDELRKAILSADNPKRLEDLYHPYKRKKSTLADLARQRGLEPLALAIWNADPVVANLEEVLPTLINPEQELNTTDAVLEGAGHLLAELVADAADVRGAVRHIMWESGRLATAKSEKLPEGQGQEFRSYFSFSEDVKTLPPHRIQAINRGEKEHALTARIDWDAPAGRQWALERLPLPRKADAPEPEPPQGRGRGGHPPFVSRLPDLEAHPHRAFLEHVVDDALSRLLVPSLEREIRRELTQRAEQHAVGVFARNLRAKLLAPPLRGKRVLAIDPALRTGCKLAMLDETGNLLDHAVVFPHQPQNKKAEAKRELERLIRKHGAQVVAIGNGTACRETEELVSDLIADLEARRANPDAQDPLMIPPPPPPVRTRLVHPEPPAGWHPLGEEPPPLPQLVEIPPPPPPVLEKLPDAPAELAYVIVNEAGASVYSASPIGKEEFPQFDATLRGTVSIGRRLQDPLSELVKIEPQHVGVGQYQHDVQAKHLREALESVVESCVNTVGVDLNTASRPLLQNVSGLGPKLAEDIVAYRKANGPFKSREGIKQVPGIGEGRFVQAAGFLKIEGGEEPLDRTWIHPETYPAARVVLEELGFSPADLSDNAKLEELRKKMDGADPQAIAAKLHEKGITIAGDSISPATVGDIFDALARPGRDLREDLPPPVFKKGVLKLEDLQAGMELKGTVLNVVDFGAFIDIGLKDSGLVHISQMANRYVKTPHDVVAVGDTVTVYVLKVEGERHRVSLSMIAPGAERKPQERRP
ncbi:MAG: RNA-binding transcriptional accessory protein, partial [Gemmataceae bacterium]|nr:RNA-binding transcriptional accessory protein [Gemmataceae bacterium]